MFICMSLDYIAFTFIGTLFVKYRAVFVMMMGGCLSSKGMPSNSQIQGHLKNKSEVFQQENGPKLNSQN